jgi:hypothetical protein
MTTIEERLTHWHWLQHCTCFFIHIPLYIHLNSQPPSTGLINTNSEQSRKKVKGTCNKRIHNAPANNLHVIPIFTKKGESNHPDFRHETCTHKVSKLNNITYYWGVLVGLVMFNGNGALHTTLLLLLMYYEKVDKYRLLNYHAHGILKYCMLKILLG